MPPMNRHKTDLIIVHCSATPPDMDIGVEDIRRWHLQQGWRDIGYHFVIRIDGSIESGRDLDVVGAHCYGHNSHSVGICMVGGWDPVRMPASNYYTAAQWQALEDLIGHLTEEEFPEAKVAGHNQFANKACPSFDVQEWLGVAGMEDLKYVD